jgi:hypothetical protein
MSALLHGRPAVAFGVSLCVAALVGFAGHAPSPAPRSTQLVAGPCYTVGLTDPPYTSVTVCPPV